MDEYSTKCEYTYQVTSGFQVKLNWKYFLLLFNNAKPTIIFANGQSITRRHNHLSHGAFNSVKRKVINDNYIFRNVAFIFRQSLAPLDIHLNQWTAICVLMHINNSKRIHNCVKGQSFEGQSNSITFLSHRVTINSISRQSLAWLLQTLEPLYKQ